MCWTRTLLGSISGSKLFDVLAAHAQINRQDAPSNPAYLSLWSTGWISFSEHAHGKKMCNASMAFSLTSSGSRITREMYAAQTCSLQSRATQNPPRILAKLPGMLTQVIDDALPVFTQFVHGKRTHDPSD